jgi:hypothetical protein
MRTLMLVFGVAFAAGAGAPVHAQTTVQECVCDFIENIGAQKEPNGRVSVNGSSLKGDPAQVGHPVQVLRACLAAIDVFEIDNETTYNCNGLTVQIDLGKDGGTPSERTSAETGSATGDTSADVVISIGGSGSGTSAQSGGAAAATNNKPGGAAVAVGGNGSPGAHNGGGTGGGATAKSLNANGTSVARGGNGGGANPGGTGTAESGDGGDADACAQGGEGGDPTDEPPDRAGGDGGSATARVGATNFGTAGGGTNCPAGQHGTGGTERRRGGGVPGTTARGICTDNS